MVRARVLSPCPTGNMLVWLLSWGEGYWVVGFGEGVVWDF